MPIDVDIEVRNLREVQREMERVAAQLHGTPMVQAFRDATLMLQRDAKINAPVDTGRLRASITPEVTVQGKDIQGVVGSNVAYAPFMELGTRAHFPPRSSDMGNLERWAERHGTTWFVVARSIARKELAARRFLQEAFEKNKSRIMARIERGVEEAIK